MKKYFLLIAMLTGCSNTSTPPESVLISDKEVQPLTRAEVIAGINECETAGMRPIVISAKRKINGQITPSVIEVTCLPKLK
jgi:hypothetical protein